MRIHRCWWQWTGGAVAGLLVLTLLAGCGEEKAPTVPTTNPPAKATGVGDAPATPAADKTYACPKCGMAAKAAGDCPHCKVAVVEKPAPTEGAGAMAANADAPKVFACMHCNKVAATAGDCAGCKMKMTEVAVANPDPAVCVSSGEKMEKPVYSIVNGKVYGTCCNDCVADLKKDPDAVVKKAMERAQKTQ